MTDKAMRDAAMTRDDVRKANALLDELAATKALLSHWNNNAVIAIWKDGCHDPVAIASKRRVTDAVREAIKDCIASIETDLEAMGVQP